MSVLLLKINFDDRKSFNEKNLKIILKDILKLVLLNKYFLSNEKIFMNYTLKG